VPYDVALPATATSEIVVTGNISSDAANVAQAQILTSSLQYTYDGGRDATESTELDQCNQFSGGSEADGQLGVGETGTLAISGYNPDGSALSSGLSFTVTGSTTLGDLITHLNTNVLNGATASLSEGRIRITDDQGGYSKSDIALSYTGAGLLETPPYFELTAVGGEEVKNVNIAIYDSQGGKHVLSAALVRTDTVNTWDMVLASVSGNVESISPDNRRINNLAFSPQTGAFAGVPIGEDAQFTITFDHDVPNPQTIAMNFGTIGSFDGLTQFAGTSTAVAREQDGYEAGHLTSVWVNNDGVLTGAFSNGIKKDIAALQMSLFSNPGGLQGVGGGYFSPSANSGDAVATQATHSGAGSIHGGALEKSNADVATEFVSMIQAQNGYQANARTVRVATEILTELTNLIR
jgi:flagellar hook protein FlgE